MSVSTYKVLQFSRLEVYLANLIIDDYKYISLKLGLYIGNLFEEAILPFQVYESRVHPSIVIFSPSCGADYDNVVELLMFKKLIDSVLNAISFTMLWFSNQHEHKWIFGI